MKTRKSVKPNYLIGRKPPRWYELASDACSLPMGRLGQFLLRGGQARHPCYRHDYGYYIRDIMWDRSNPEWEVEWTSAKFAADMELKINRKLVAKNAVFGTIYSMLYFRAVRAAARKKALKPRELPVPPTLNALARLEASIDEPLTSRAELIFATWKTSISSIESEQ